jgi:hypothetical protein
LHSVETQPLPRDRLTALKELVKPDEMPTTRGFSKIYWQRPDGELEIIEDEGEGTKQ